MGQMKKLNLLSTFSGEDQLFSVFIRLRRNTLQLAAGSFIKIPLKRRLCCEYERRFTRCHKLLNRIFVKIYP